MPTFTLEDLGKAVEEKYAPTIVQMGEAGDLVLQPTVRLSDDDMARLSAVQRKFNSIQQSEEPEYVDEDGKPREATADETAAFEAQQMSLRPKMIALLKEMLCIYATDVQYAEKFFEHAKDDLPTYIVLVEKHGKSAQLGEASASPSS